MNEWIKVFSLFQKFNFFKMVDILEGQNELKLRFWGRQFAAWNADGCWTSQLLCCKSDLPIIHWVRRWDKISLFRSTWTQLTDEFSKINEGRVQSVCNKLCETPCTSGISLKRFWQNKTTSISMCPRIQLGTLRKTW